MKAQTKSNPLKHFNDVKAAQLKKASKGAIMSNMNSLPEAQRGGCNFSRAQRKNQRTRAWNNFKEKGAGIVGGILGAGAAGVGGYFGYKKLKEKQ
jgi:hypothetical protein